MRELELAGAAASAEELAGPRPERAGDGPKHAARHTECLNCGAALHGRFCHACGQAADDHHRSMLHLAWEAVEGLFHLDGRLARTLPLLFLHPGRLARDHFEGRRQRHVPPFRLFLVTLLLFMLALEGLVHGGGHEGSAHGPAAAAPRLGQAVAVRDPDGSVRTVTVPSAEQISRWTGGRVSAGAIEAAARREGEGPGAVQGHAADSRLSLAGGAIQLGEGAPAPPPPGDKAKSAAYTLGRSFGRGARGQVTSAPATSQGDVRAAVDKFEAASKTHSATGDWFITRVRKAADNKEYFTAVLFGWAHRLAVLLLPITAGFLTLLYGYKRRFYVYDHLTVAMHFLSFGFIVWGVVYLLPKSLRDAATLAGLLWTFANLFMTLRGAYGSGIVGAGLKTVVLWLATMTAFGLLVAGLLLIALGQM